jgi:hypothetical protein
MDTNNVTRQSQVSIDVSSPTANVTGPVSGSSTQNERPTFSGSVSDAGSGLDISSITVAYDNLDDAANGTPVIGVSNGVLSGSARPWASLSRAQLMATSPSASRRLLARTFRTSLEHPTTLLTGL